MDFTHALNGVAILFLGVQINVNISIQGIIPKFVGYVNGSQWLKDQG